MGCCLLAALIISVVRRAWYALPGRTAPVVDAFAPAASRPAPGSHSQALAVEVPVPAVRRIGWPLVAAATVAAYALGTSLLGATGVVTDGASPLVPPLGRDLALVALIVVTALIAFGTRQPPVSRLDATAVALTASGATWTALGVLDMHVLGVVDVGHPALLADLLVHGTGLALLFTGLALLRAPRLAARPRTQGALP